MFCNFPKKYFKMDIIRSENGRKGIYKKNMFSYIL